MMLIRFSQQWWQQFNTTMASRYFAQMVFVFLYGIGLTRLPIGGWFSLGLLVAATLLAPLWVIICLGRFTAPGQRTVMLLSGVFLTLLGLVGYLALIRMTTGDLTGSHYLLGLAILALPIILAALMHRWPPIILVLDVGAWLVLAATLPASIVLLGYAALLLVVTLPSTILLLAEHARLHIASTLPIRRLLVFILIVGLSASLIPTPTVLQRPLQQTLATLMLPLQRALAPLWPGTVPTGDPFLAPQPLMGTLNLSSPGVVATYRTTGQPTYFPAHAYADYHANTWWPDDDRDVNVPPDHVLTPPPSAPYLVPMQTIIHRMNKAPTLLTPGRFVSANQPSDLSYHDATADILAWRLADPERAPASYIVTSEAVQIAPELLAQQPDPMTSPASYGAALLARYTQMPPSLKGAQGQELRATAQQWVSGATTMADRVAALVTHFHDGSFRYSLVNPDAPTGIDAATFILHTKQGYCMWYATALALMARSLGYPARVMTGYEPGTYDTLTNTWTITSDEAHMWTQVYFPNEIGWVDFDATPGFSKVTVSLPIGKPTTLPNLPVLDQTPPSHLQPASLPLEQISTFLLVVLAGATLYLSGYGAWRGLRMRRLPQARRHFQRMTNLARWRGIWAVSSETASEYGVRMARRFPGAAAEITALTESFVAERWGSQTPDERKLSTLVQRIRRALFTPELCRKKTPHFR